MIGKITGADNTVSWSCRSGKEVGGIYKRENPPFLDSKDKRDIWQLIRE